MFRWPALEENSDLGTFRGEGRWAASTLVVSPVTNEPTVTFFGSEAEAIDYARDRAFKTGIPLRPSGESGSEKGRIYYVLDYLDLEDPKVVYRVLRGNRGVRREAGSSVQGQTQEQVLVFRNAGALPGNKTRWTLERGLTIDVQDLEAEREKQKRARGPQMIRRSEKTGDPAMYDPHRRPKPARTAEPRAYSADERKLFREQQQEADRRLKETRAASEATQRARVAESAGITRKDLTSKMRELVRLKEHNESKYMETREKKYLLKVELIDAQLLELEERLQ